MEYDSESDCIKVRNTTNNNPSEFEIEDHTAELMKQIANSLTKEIQFTVDFPANHEDKMMPVLDLKVLINQNKISHVFYRKECSRPCVILNRSAVSAGIKRNVIFQEGLRIIRNCSTDTPANTVNHHLTVFMNSLRRSGYNERYRLNMIRGIRNRAKQIEENINSGKWRRYRSDSLTRASKLKRPGRYASTWFLGGGVRDTIRTSITPGSTLATQIRSKLNMIQDKTRRTKVIESSGKPVYAGLRTKDPFNEQQLPN